MFWSLLLPFLPCTYNILLSLKEILKVEVIHTHKILITTVPWNMKMWLVIAILYQPESLIILTAM